MSDVHRSFIELALEGRVLLDEIDDFVDAWHKEPSGKSLHKYLGMTKPEYSLWLRDPDALGYIVKARHDEMPLAKIVNDNYQQFRMAARSESSGKIKRLKQWLKEQGKLD